MRTHAALLRGINVGGHGRLPMAELRALAEALGHTEVATYIQSGNLVFAARDPRAAPSALAGELETALAEQTAVAPNVVVLTRAELSDVVAANPFAALAPEPKQLHAVLHAEAPGAAAAAALAEALERAAAKDSPDAAVLDGRTLYLHTPGGLGRSVLAVELARPRVVRTMGAATARNWATMLKLTALLDA